MVLILMGVVGSGKTTVGQLLARKLGWQFADADDFHPAANIAKISHGVPLTDADRAPWLTALRVAIEQWSASRQNVILACSALKRSYREELRAGAVRFVYLKADYDLVQQRLRSRKGHFASDSILQSQFADLEEPKAEDSITVEVSKSPDEIVSQIIEKLNLNKPAYPDAAQT